MNPESLQAIKDKAHDLKSGLFSLLEDLAKHGGVISSEQVLLMIALNQFSNDSSCVIIDLIAPESPENDLNEHHKYNRQLLQRWIDIYYKGYGVGIYF